MAEHVDYQALIRAAPDLYLILSPDLKVLDASDAYLQATMVRREDIVGRHIFEVFPRNPRDPGASDAQDKFLRSLHVILKYKTSHLMPIQRYDIRRPDGEYETRYWSPLTYPILNEAQEVQYLLHRAEDVTELDKLQQLEHAGNKRFELLIENIKDYAIIMLDTEGVVTTWNAGAEYIMGYSAADAIGKLIAMIYPADPPGAFKYELNVAKTKGRYEAQGWRVSKNGAKYWAGAVITPIYIKSMYHKDNYLIGYGMVIRDLTLQKEIETVKNEFVSIVNHELRTPLTSIFGAIRLLSNWSMQSEEKNDHLLNVANSNCERLLQLINDILDIEKLAVGSMSLHFQVTDLSPLISYAVSLNQMFSENYGVGISFSPLQPDVQVKVDVSRLIQVLTNLISNAVKFSHHGCDIKVDLKKQENTVRVSVTNQGQGIPEAFKNKIFEKFSQADASTTRSENGTGLGLAISKQIVERFGSAIKYRSIPNKETTFYFDLNVV